MKQKNAQAKAAAQQKVSAQKQKKDVLAAATEEVVEKVEKMEVVKSPPKPQPKTPARKAPPPKVVEEEEEDDEDEDDSANEEEDSGADVDAAEEFMDADAAEDDDDDDEPAEAPIGKNQDGQAAKSGGFPKINTGNVPQYMSDDQVLIVTNLPKKFKQVDIVDVFAKYGTIHTIKPVHEKEGTTVYIAFSAPEEAEAALAANETAQVKGSVIQVERVDTNLRKPPRSETAEERQRFFEERQKKLDECKDRTVYVKNLKRGTTDKQVKRHFEAIGTVQEIKVITRQAITFAFVVFATPEEAVEAAKKLHNSLLKERTIGVFLKGDENSKTTGKDPKRTVLIKNKQLLKTVSVEQFTSIFAACGEIENVDILCKRNVLAFVTFKEETSAKKALELSGTTVEDLELEIVEYQSVEDKPKTSVFMQNVKPGVTEDEIRELFAATGEIENIFIKGGFAIIKFKDTDGFCKSFLLNESQLQGQLIFLEPYSERKQHVLKMNHRPHLGKRKPMPWKGGNQKRFKQHE